MNRPHKYELTHNKGQHIKYSNNYVWECAACGKSLVTTEKITPKGAGCKPVQIRTIKPTS